MDPLDDEYLIKRVLAGEDQPFNLIIDRYKDLAMTLATNILNNRQDAEEVTQDSFVKAYRNLHRFNHQSKFSTWFYRIVTNTAITYKNKRKQDTADIELIQQGSAPEVGGLEHQDRQFFLQQGLAQLSDPDRIVISLFYLKELSLEEIAVITGYKTNLVKVKLFRARKRLAEIMKRLLKQEALNL